jgi:hypothetical protein
VQGPLRVHADHNMHALHMHVPAWAQINKLVREIEVSHWGNIYVEESYEIVSVMRMCL